MQNKKPWQMTQEEYIRHHRTSRISESAYESYKTRDGFEFLADKSKYPVLHSKKIFGGAEIEFRQSGEKSRYVATNEQNEIIRDEKGMATYLTDEEIAQQGLNTHDTSIVAYDDQGPIGLVSNEFGVPGVWVVEEYQRKGIGTYLLDQWMRQRHENQKIGQMTYSGEQMSRSYHKLLVKKALEKGLDVPEEVFMDTYPDLIPKSYKSFEHFVKRWQGKSITVDQEGKPLILYRGTDQNDENFDIDSSGGEHGNWLGEGIYFSDSFDVAKDYGDHVHAFFVKLKNPAILTDDFIHNIHALRLGSLHCKGSKYTFGEIMNKEMSVRLKIGHNVYFLERSGLTDAMTEYQGEQFFVRNVCADTPESNEYVKERLAAIILRKKYDMPDLRSFGHIGCFTDPKILVEKLRENGYDGIISEGSDILGIDSKEYVVFDSSQALQVKDAVNAWMKNSQVKDSQGQPLSVYHGTPHEFEKFDTLKNERDSGYFGTGAYFCSERSIATSYGENLHESYLNLQNPLFVHLGSFVDYQQWKEMKYPGMSQDDARAALEFEGYDGVIISVEGEKNKEFVVFDPDSVLILNESLKQAMGVEVEVGEKKKIEIKM